jgi:hypothetical protein
MDHGSSQEDMNRTRIPASTRGRIGMYNHSKHDDAYGGLVAMAIPVRAFGRQWSAGPAWVTVAEGAQLWPLGGLRPHRSSIQQQHRMPHSA